MKEPREHSIGDPVIVSVSRGKQPVAGTVTDYRQGSYCLEYRIKGDPNWHKAGNVQRAED